MSTPLFDDIPADMTADEQEISRSTPNYRFDSPPPPPAEKDANAAPSPVVAEDARDFLRSVTRDKEQPVVLFALEWCEFSWSVRKMFAHYEIPYRSVDLDSVAYQDGNRGGEIRAAIQEQTGQKTIPQIYIGGTHVGGSTELFDAAKDGTMGELLKENGVSWNQAENRDPYSFLPGWLHAR
jgi:cysteine synthase A